MEPALTILEKADSFSEFMHAVVLRRHLQEIPDQALREEFVAELTAQAAHDDPPYSLDYWRLNLNARAPD